MTIDHDLEKTSNFKSFDAPEPAMDESAASLVEYALLVALISLVCIAAVSLLGNATSSKFGSLSTAIDNAS